MIVPSEKEVNSSIFQKVTMIDFSCLGPIFPGKEHNLSSGDYIWELRKCKEIIMIPKFQQISNYRSLYPLNSHSSSNSQIILQIPEKPFLASPPWIKEEPLVKY